MKRAAAAGALAILFTMTASSCSTTSASVLDGYETGPIAPATKSKSQESKTPVIAIIDGGVNQEHPSLSGVIIKSRSAPHLASAGPSDHATQLAGIIAGKPAGDFPGGIAPGTEVLDARALGPDGLGDLSDVAAAVHWASEQHVDVILTSLATERNDPALADAISNAVNQGILVVASTGNGFSAADQYPAMYPGVLAVTAHDRDGRHLVTAVSQGADYSAPGAAILAPTSTNQTAEVSGTSVSAAVAAALAVTCLDRHSLVQESIKRDTERIKNPESKHGGISPIKCNTHIN